MYFLDTSLTDSLPAVPDFFLPQAQTPNELQTIVDENGRLICFACTEGLYCSVAASLHQQPQTNAAPFYYNAAGAVSRGPPPLVFNRNEWANEVAHPMDSDAYKPSFTNLVPVSMQQMRHVPEQAPKMRTFENTIEEVFIKNDLSDQDEHELMYQHEVIPTLDENGNRKRYSRFRTKNHVCDFCNKSFTLKQNVQTHMSLYHMSSQPVQRPLERRFQCNLCTEIFKTAKAGIVHKKKVHGEPKDSRANPRCEFCNQMFLTSKALTEHVRSYHGGERPFSCGRCDAKFGRRSGLQRHVKMVHDGVLHPCTFPGCDHPGFKCPKALESHLQGVHHHHE